jgi:hypothetical protein
MSYRPICLQCCGVGAFASKTLLPFCETEEEVKHNSFKCDICDGAGQKTSGLATLDWIIRFCNDMKPNEQGTSSYE